MIDSGSTLLTAAGVFTGTNVDDLIVLTVLFLSARAGGRPRTGQVWAGQYLGIAILVAVSIGAALGLAVVPDRWVGLLGAVPFALGVKGLVSAIRARDEGGTAAPGVAGGVVSVAGVTIGNGADNVSVYTPMFRTIGPAATVVTVLVFAAGVALWCAAGSWLGSHERVIHMVERHGSWIVPIVFMTIGTVIVAESGVIGHLVGQG